MTRQFGLITYIVYNKLITISTGCNQLEYVVLNHLEQLAAYTYYVSLTMLSSNNHHHIWARLKFTWQYNKKYCLKQILSFFFNISTTYVVEVHRAHNKLLFFLLVINSHISNNNRKTKLVIIILISQGFIRWLILVFTYKAKYKCVYCLNL